MILKIQLLSVAAVLFVTQHLASAQRPVKSTEKLQTKDDKPVKRVVFFPMPVGSNINLNIQVAKSVSRLYGHEVGY